jgi:hypothetical protein
MKGSKHHLGINKKTAVKAVNYVVDPGDIFWNPFFEIIFKWTPILKQIYEAQARLDEP